MSIFFLFRQNTISSHDVPYYRLLESSPKAQTSSKSIDKAGPVRQDSESRLLTPKTLIVQAPKTSASDSRLTVEYFQDETAEVSNLSIIFVIFAIFRLLQKSGITV